MIERASALPPALWGRVRSLSELVATQPYEWVVIEARRIAPIVSEVLFEVGDALEAGRSTRDVHDALVDRLWARGLAPAMLGYQGYPFGCAIALNDELVGGLPSETRTLAPGDLVKIEIGAVSGWAFAGQGWTFVVGEPSRAQKTMLRAGQRALSNALLRVRQPGTIGDVGAIIQSTLEPAGFSVVRSHVGYGMGHKRIMAPQIPGWGEPGTLAPIVPGSILHVHVIFKAGPAAPDAPSQPPPPVASQPPPAPPAEGDAGAAEADAAATAPASPAPNPDDWTVRSHDGKPGAIFTAMVEATVDGHRTLSTLPVI